MSWSPLFDRTHIISGVPVDADIELKCSKCKTLYRTLNAYYIGYSEIYNTNPANQGKCIHSIKDLEPTKNWFPTRDIHKQANDGTWASLFDYSHILEGAPVDANIELRCRRCKTLFYTKNAYYVGYSEIYYLNPEEQAKCNHNINDLKATKRWLNDQR